MYAHSMHQYWAGMHTLLSVQCTLQWRHNEYDGASIHQPHDCLLDGLFRRRSREASKLRLTGLCVRNSPETGEFPAQRASNAENVSIWWRHHDHRGNLCLYTKTHRHKYTNFLSVAIFCDASPTIWFIVPWGCLWLWFWMYNFET